MFQGDHDNIFKLSEDWKMLFNIFKVGLCEAIAYYCQRNPKMNKAHSLGDIYIKIYNAGGDCRMHT